MSDTRKGTGFTPRFSGAASRSFAPVRLPAEPWDASAYAAEVEDDRNIRLAPSPYRMCAEDGCRRRVPEINKVRCAECRAERRARLAAGKGTTG